MQSAQTNDFGAGPAAMRFTPKGFSELNPPGWFLDFGPSGPEVALDFSHAFVGMAERSLG